MERLQQDLLHQLELEDTSYHNRAHIASQLKQCRTKRRIAKDFLAASEPLVNYLKTDGGIADPGGNGADATSGKGCEKQRICSTCNEPARILQIPKAGKRHATYT